MSADLIHGTELKSDFQIRTPTATCSVRGTKFSIGYDTIKFETSVEVTEDGPIHFNPANAELPSGLVRAGTDALIGIDSVTGTYQPLAAPLILGYKLTELAAVSDLGPLIWEPGGQLLTIGGGQISKIHPDSGIVSPIANLDEGNWLRAFRPVLIFYGWLQFPCARRRPIPPHSSGALSK